MMDIICTGSTLVLQANRDGEVQFLLDFKPIRLDLNKIFKKRYLHKQQLQSSVNLTDIKDLIIELKKYIKSK